jgi:hypothetical protein
MSYTAKQIDKMSIDELESLANMLTFEDRMTWSGSGYDGDTFIKLTNKK